jgi:hypothetical protein
VYRYRLGDRHITPDKFRLYDATRVGGREGHFYWFLKKSYFLRSSIVRGRFERSRAEEGFTCVVCAAHVKGWERSKITFGEAAKQSDGTMLPREVACGECVDRVHRIVEYYLNPKMPRPITSGTLTIHPDGGFRSCALCEESTDYRPRATFHDSAGPQVICDACIDFGPLDVTDDLEGNPIPRVSTPRVTHTSPARSVHAMTLRDNCFTETIARGKWFVVFWMPGDPGGRSGTFWRVLDQLAQVRGDVRIGKLNVDLNQLMSLKYRATSVPTTIFFEDGIEKARLVGTSIDEFVRQHLSDEAILK